MENVAFETEFVLGCGQRPSTSYDAPWGSLSVQTSRMNAVKNLYFRMPVMKQEANFQAIVLYNQI